MKQPLKLLVIEDDEIDREAVYRLLQVNYRVRHAATAQAALEMVQADPPQVVLLDYHLPDTDGFELLRTLVRRGLPVIMLTVEQDPEIVVEAMKCGAQDYVVKTRITQARLDLAITNAVEKFALRRELVDKQHRLVEQAMVLEEKNRQVRDLASELALAEQRERRRISQILHDEVQQLLHGLHVQTLLMSSSLSDRSREETQPYFDEVERLVEQAIKAVRTLSVELYPPVLKSEGLSAAFEWLALQMKATYNFEIELNVENSEDGFVDDDLRVLIFQLVRELLFNVIKHAQVKQAELEMIDRDHQLVIHVKDKGNGFDTTAVTEETQTKGFGLYSIRERLDLFGGRLEIESEPGQGTQATIIVPKEGNEEKGGQR